VFNCDGLLIVAVNKWCGLTHGVGAARARKTYLALLRPELDFWQRMATFATHNLRPSTITRGCF